jgi:hypothetical protein
MVGVGKEALFRSTAMEGDLGAQRRPGTMSASPLGSKKGSRHLHTPHAAARHSARRRFWNVRSGSSVVVTQHPTQSFPARHITGGTAHFFARLYQLVVESLMVSLLMIMNREIGHSVLQ